MLRSNHFYLKSFAVKMASGITFYFETKEQIGHLECIFDSHFPSKKWKKCYEPPKKNIYEYFKYFKYLTLKSDEGQTMFGILQFYKRTTISGVKKLFAEEFGIFKIHKIKRIERPMIVPHLKLELIKRKHDVNIREFRTFSFGGASRDNVEAIIKRKLSFYDEYKYRFHRDDPSYNDKEYCRMMDELNEFVNDNKL